MTLRQPVMLALMTSGSVGFEGFMAVGPVGFEDFMAAGHVGFEAS